MSSKEDIKNTIQKLFLDVQNEDNVDIVNDLSKLFDTQDINVLYNQIENNVVSTVINRKGEGDISTPKALVNEMLDKLPGKVWSNRCLKWFDPAVGRGVFMIEVYRRLMNGLIDIFENTDNRRDYILNNMLYMSELNPINVEITKSVFNHKNTNLARQCNTHKENSNYLKIELHKNLNIKININTIIKEQKENSIEFELANPDELHQYIQDSNNSKMIDNKDLVRAFLELNLKPKEKEKKQFGEVFTPQTLINEMLDKLPAEVWKNSTLRWFDPAVGIGNFMIEIYYRLMEGLVEQFPDFETRKTHIISNMLYMSELNPANTKTCRRIFGDGLNIYEGDTLGLDTSKVFGVDAFDIIVGNPPYNKSQKAKGKRGGGDALWPAFVKFSIDLLNDNGYLLFVHPPNWRKPESEHSKNRGLYELITKDNTLVYLEIHDSKDGLRVFRSGTRYDFYLLKRIVSTTAYTTTVKCEDSKIYFIQPHDWDWLPNKNFDIIKKIMSNNRNNYGSDVIYNRNNYGSDKPWVSDKQDDKFRYPLIHSTPKEGVRYKYSSINSKGHFGVPKIIFGESGINYVIIDIDGKYGMTQGAIGLKVNNLQEAEAIKQTLLNPKFKTILESTQFGNFRIDWRVFTYFKKDFWKEFI